MLGAKEPATFHVGDVLGADVVTPVALEVVDPTATAALQSIEALKAPAIFRSEAYVTNALMHQFQATFDETHASFISALQDTFHQTLLDHAAVTSPDFGYLVTAFNINHKKFPIPMLLAKEWAYGKTGAVEKDKWFNALWQQVQSAIRPDDLPAGFDLGKNFRLVPVNHLSDRLTLGDVTKRGQTLATTNLLPIAQVRTQFRRAFTDDDEQPLARALAAWLQPTCLPDAALTQIARERAVHHLVVAEHYAAGQIIAPQGSVIDAKIKAALDALAGQPPSGASNQPSAIIAADEANESPVAIPAQSKITTATPAIAAPTGFAHSWEKVWTRKKGWIIGAGAVAIFALIALGRWLAQRHRARLVANVTKDLPWQTPVGLQTELAPQLVRAVQSAIVQELAGQRSHLLLTQQVAATEVIRLVHKMDELQVAMQERLQTYEAQIRELETELTARTEENRELIQLKIEMIRHQLEVETLRREARFN